MKTTADCRDAPQLAVGLYDRLLTLALQRELDGLGDARRYSLAPIDAEDADTAVVQFLEHLLADALAAFRGRGSEERLIRIVRRITSILSEELGQSGDHASLVTPLHRLLAVPAKRDANSPRPDTPLARSALLTGTRLDPSLGCQLQKEIATADRVDILCSFIRWSGLRLILDALRDLTDREASEQPRLRVITTSYMGATSRLHDLVADFP